MSPSRGGRVLVLGGRGMLGHVVVGHLRACGLDDVAWTTRGGEGGGIPFDALEGPERLFAEHGPCRWVVNCVAVLQSQIDERDAASVRRAERVNAEFPRRLAVAASAAGACVLHVSTDAVFPASAGRCGERTPPAPGNVYATTKLGGEVAAANVLNLRCSLVGPDPWHGRGLVEWLRSRPPGARVPGFSDQCWVGATTGQVAELCRLLMSEGLFDRAAREGPVHHFCPCEPVSKYELLRHLAAALRLDVEVVPVASAQPVTRRLDTDYRAIAAALPKYGPLDAALTALSSAPPQAA